jgi:hypothetical protein
MPEKIKKCYVRITGTTTFCGNGESLLRDKLFTRYEEEEKKTNLEKAKEAREWYTQNKR